MDTRYWNREFMTRFLEVYKSHICLWKVGSKEYKNRYLKTKAYGELVELCKTIYDKADQNYVVKKIQAIRGSFRKEFKKVEQSKRKGIAAYRLYAPRLWYYDLLLFTKDEKTPNESLNNETVEDSETTEEGDFHENPETLPANKNEKENDTSKVQETTPRQRSVNATSAVEKRRNTEESGTFLNTCTRVLTTDEDEYTAFGITVAAKLRKMDENQRVYAENVINQALFKGQLKKLRETSTVTDTARPKEKDILTSPYASS